MIDDVRASKIKPRDIEVLRELESATRDCLYATPLNCGRRDSSDHSYRLSKLVKLGLAESQQRSAWACSRGSKEYRLSTAGRALWERIKNDD
jgi:hypothetical protein